MRNVERLQEPPSLQRNAAKWKKELLSAIKKFESKGTIVPKHLYERYKQEDIKETLSRMYNKLCCYCESSIYIVAYPHIEHRKPKHRFVENTFDWHNLHLACPACNTTKGEKWNQKREILDAVADIPISEHLEYQKEWILGKSGRGETTIEHTELNREDLRSARREVFDATLELLETMNNNVNDTRNSVRVHQLKVKSKGKYGSLISYALQTFLDRGLRERFGIHEF